MAEYTLATERLSSGGSSGGLKADTIQAGAGASIRAPQISAGAGQVQFTPSNIPKPVENMVSKGVQHFMGVTAEAVFEYQDRVDTYRANEVLLDFTERARNSFYGSTDAQGKFTPGYSHAKKGAAGDLYGEYRKNLDGYVESVLQNADPRVKQKVLVQLQGAKNTYLAKGATHQATEMNAARKDQQAKQRQALVIELAADPQAMYRPNALRNGDTIKAEFYRTFDSVDAATIAWTKLIGDSTASAYFTAYDNVMSTGGQSDIALQQGLNAAQNFLASGGMQELMANPNELRSIQGSLKRWESEAQRGFNAQTQREYTQMVRDRNEYQLKNIQDIYKDKERGIYYTSDEMDGKAGRGEIGFNESERYKNDANPSLDNNTDAHTIMMAKEQIRKDVLEGKEVSEWQVMFGREFKSQKDIDLLKKYEDTMRNPVLSPAYKAGMARLKSNATFSNWFGTQDQEAKNTAMNTFSSQLVELIRKNGPDGVNNYIADMIETIPKAAVAYEKLIALPGMHSRPNSSQQFQDNENEIAERANLPANNQRHLTRTEVSVWRAQLDQMKKAWGEMKDNEERIKATQARGR